MNYKIYGICNDQFLSSFIGHCLKCIMKKLCMGIMCLYDEIQFVLDHKKVFNILVTLHMKACGQ